MKFDTPAGTNPIDRAKVVGKPHPRIEGPLKTTGRAVYSYENHEAAPNAAYGYVVGSGIAKGRISSMDMREAKAAPGVLAIVTADNAGPIKKQGFYVAKPLAGPEVEHYHQAIALVVAETFEQARHAASLIRVDYAREQGAFDLAAARAGAKPHQRQPDVRIGDFDTAFASAPVKVDATYTTPDHSHMMLEPHATIARWDGDHLTIWSAQQIVGWARRDLGKKLGIPQDRIRVVATYIGGGFGGKGSVCSDAILAALGARAVGRAVKVTLPRPLMPNNTSHRPATIQRVRLAAGRDGKLVAVGHETLSGNLPGGGPEIAAAQTQLLYSGTNRLNLTRLATLDLPEGNAMRAPGEASGLMALEVAMDELAEKLGMDPVELRVINDTQVVPGEEGQTPRPFSIRQLVPCLRTGAERFGWKDRPARPGSRREGRWLIGMGMASAIRSAPIIPASGRVTLDGNGIVTVESNMTDMGTGSYTIIGQTVAEMIGLPLDRVVVKLADSNYPEAFGGGGQGGAASATAGAYAACVKLREAVATKLGFNSADAEFVDGEVRAGNRRAPLAQAAKDGAIIAEDRMEYGDLSQRFSQQTFGAHFCEVAVDAYTGEIRIRRMLAVCAAGRILNPITARSQVIGGMVGGAGAALMEELAVDKRFGFFVNHDLAGYEVPVHADIPHQEVIFLEETDPTMSPVKAKGVGELGISGVAPAIANAVYNATGVRIREYPMTLDKHLTKLPEIV
ncbi:MULTISPECIES: aldehyde oxidoreductase molybdenum-binding subunit PaoC [unclassified Sphingomonas]|uniref:aldehyde oxidoreductase molybdenum-binding subunit PaoC n=1 Tax=unclassified Sphingomonas TaxID=196159 RepID=UPI0006F422C5|nr:MULTISPECIES: aldehyde oxidoreductase molybdenum-binding subunit PaoC [unclassified Sphingomonas]KQM66300.1 xanthine dehydrogenase [Sphingomonas sp. Leaf16]KQN08756.1 xanthine dehydrogenase [Sphingomonas sp. Leaf29]KQN17337.1 xanthine dehydrogenase [Sphingomonas sp. Leaf32]